GGASTGLRVLVADEDRAALDGVAKLLHQLGHEVCARAVAVEEVSQRIDEDEPDVALVKLHDDDQHALDLIDEITDEATCPVIALMEVPEAGFISRAAKHGIYAYVQPVTTETVQGAIEVAMRRHAEAERLSDQVEELEGALQRRAVIERAKGILMERHMLDDAAAFELLRSHARANNRKLVDVARAVSDGHLLLPRE
ncbi:MAG TPA: ANTAR domain-containing protein, partial [Thermoleophilaceae bacterium]|nr:ANTAR domain-containing protein [Thermoleophilaceae bacterium]